MLKTTALRQVIVAMVIAVAAATVHGAWFAPTAAVALAPEAASVRLSTWDEYQRVWTHTFLVDGALIRNSESQIVEFRTQSTGTMDVGSIPAYVQVLSAAQLQELNIPQAPAVPTDAVMSATGTPVYGLLRVSTPNHMSATRPLGQTEPWAGPMMPTEADVNAIDGGGSVGIHRDVVLTTGATDQVSYTWDIGRWAKGDVFLGLNNSTYKVLDRHGEFKRFVANADYDREITYNAGTDDEWVQRAGAITTGCAANWQTGEVYATNFDEMAPAVHIIARHPGVDDDFPYSNLDRSISTRIMRDSAAADHWPIDTAPESVVFDGKMNMYVGHSFAHWDYDSGLTWAIDDTSGERFIGGSVFVVDENFNFIAMRKSGTADPLTRQVVGTVSERLFVDGTGALEFTGPLPYAALPGLLDLPRAFYADRTDGTWLVDGVGNKVPVRWPLGKRLHRYNNTATTGNATYAGSESATPDRDVFWTFTGRQGTDWVDLAYAPGAPGTAPSGDMVAYYTSEDAFVHRYDVQTGRQLTDFGGGRLRPRDEDKPRRFHGLRILPPGDGTGGLLVASGDAVYRFDQFGKNIQRYQVLNDPDRLARVANGLVLDWYTLEVDPGGLSFWASSHGSGWIYEFDIASGDELQRIPAVEYQFDPVHFPDGQRVEGICIMWEYTAAQEICGDGIDNDGDGLIDESCKAIEVCTADSPGDDNGDGFANANDPHCGIDEPPVAVNDWYETTQNVPLTVPGGTLKAPTGITANDFDPDNSQSDKSLHDLLRVHLVGTTTPNTAPGTETPTSAGGRVTVLENGQMAYTPKAGFHGLDTFVYLLTDYAPITGVDTPAGINLSNTATVTILVRPLVANDSYQMIQGRTLDIAAGSATGILANDPSGPLTVSAAGPLGVTPLGVNNPSITFVTANGATVTVFATGRFTYKPLPGFTGTDSFEYRGNDSFSDSFNVAKVTIVVVAGDPIMPAEVIAGNGTKVYGTSDPALTPVSTNGFVGTDAASLTLSQQREDGENVGSYVTIASATGEVLINYSVTYVGGMFTITPAPLTVQAHDKTIFQGDPLPTLDGVWTGIVTGDTITAVYTTVATSASGVGTYDILPNPHDPGGALSNYTLEIIPGTLTILPRPLPGSGVCEGGVTKLVLKYIGTDSLNGVVRGQRTAPGSGPMLDAQVSGSSPVLYTFATKDMGGLYDPVSAGRLANQFAVFIGSTQIDNVHTSCSVPIYPGMKVGTQFEIVEVWTRGGGSFGPYSSTSSAPTPPSAPGPTPAPTGVADSYLVKRGQTLTVPAGSGVLANDNAPSGATATVVTNVSRGTLTLNANGSFTYRAQSGWTGNVTFTYAVKVGSATSAPITVTIAITR